MGKTHLNLGCGKKIKKGWVNADIYQHTKEVIYCDINKKLPFKDKEFDYILIRYALEYGKDVHKTLVELYRILKVGGKIRLIVPHVSNYIESVGNFEHHTSFSLYTLKRIERERQYYVPYKFKIKRYNFVTAPHFLSKIYTKFPYLAERYFCRIFPILSMTLILEKQEGIK